MRKAAFVIVVLVIMFLVLLLINYAGTEDKKQMCVIEMESPSITDLCPLCQRPAQMARIDKETRYLFLMCFYCDIQWRALRCYCLFCQEEPGWAYYFFAEGYDYVMMRYCPAKKIYIKTLDETKDLPYDFKNLTYPEIYIKTLFLDESAWEMGYSTNQEKKQ